MNVLSVILIFICLVLAWFLGGCSFLQMIKSEYPATYMILLAEYKVKKKSLEEKDHENA